MALNTRVKYEIALSVFEPGCVWISGPHRGGKHDLTIFKQGLAKKIKNGKRVIADGGYKSKNSVLSTPNYDDSKELANFKSRARLRQEIFNGHLKFFSILSNAFRHSIDQHKLALEAVCVTVQYQMDCGSPMFDVQ